jgi:amino acid adenylation domain-containing protein
MITPQILLQEEKKALQYFDTKDRFFEQGYKIQNITPLSANQKALWYTAKQYPKTAAYIVAGALMLDFLIDEEALRYALRAIADHHPLLRTSIVEKEGIPFLLEKDNFQIPLHAHKIQGSTEHEVKQFIQNRAAIPFDIFNDSLIKVDIFEVNAGRSVFLLSVHHIIYDAWSLWQNINEIFSIYRAYTEKRYHKLSKEDLYFEEFVQQEKEFIDGREGNKILNYWREKLKDSHPLQFPVNTEKSNTPLNGKTYQKLLGEDLSIRIKECSRAANVTPFVFLLSVYKILLYKFCSQDDIIVGSPVNGRNDDRFYNAVGYFVNILPLRTYINEELTVKELLTYEKQNFLEAMRCSYPLAAMLEHLSIKREAHAQPLIQSLFVYQKIVDLTEKIFQGTPSSGELYNIKQQEGQFSMVCEVLEERKVMHLNFKYRSSLFSETAVACFAQCYDNVLNSVLRLYEKNKDEKVSKLHLLSEKEQSAFFENNHQQEKSLRNFSARTIAENFRENAKRYANKPAIRYLDQTLSYRVLEEQSNQLAHILRKKGIQKGDRVGIYLSRSSSVVVSILAILKNNATYVPLDPINPNERVHTIIEDADLKACITEEDLIGNIQSLNGFAKILLLKNEIKAQSKEFFINEESSVQDSESLPAYIIYTSGTTGKPKGVMVSHENILRLFEATNHWFQFNENDVWTLFHSYSFDFSVWELWGALLFGGCVVIIPEKIAKDTSQFIELLQQEKVTVLNQTPSAFQYLIKADAEQSKGSYALRYIIFGGEALNPQSLKPWFERYGSHFPKLINMYGITETTVHVTYRPIHEEDMTSKKSYIGEVIPDLNLYVFDRHMTPVPPGITGELYVGGKGVSLGYFRREELTPQKFIHDPIKNDGSLLYRTGDLGRYTYNGDIEYLGRIDNQIKIRGYRIETGEIEAHCRAIPGINQIYLVLVEDEVLEKQIVCFYTIKSSIEDKSIYTIEYFRKKLQHSLPDYMLPGSFIAVSEMPLTENGKIDTKSLLKTYRQRREMLITRNGDTKQMTKYQAAVHSLIKDLLSLHAVPLEVNLFDLGAHSFLIAKLIAQLEKAHGCSLEYPEVFQNLTVRGIASLLETKNEPQLKENNVYKNTPSSLFVKLSSYNDTKPLFLFAGGGGSAYYYKALADRLHSVTTYGFQCIGIDGVQVSFDTVEDLAEVYKECILRLYPQQRYTLGGHCFGGLVAYETAQLLIDEGAQIERLILMDVPFPDGKSLVERKGWDEAMWIVKISEMMSASLGHNVILNYNDLQSLSFEEMLQVLTQKMIKKELLPENNAYTIINGMVSIFMKVSSIRYIPNKNQPLPIAYCKAETIHPDYDFQLYHSKNWLEKATYGWSKAALENHLEIFTAPGDHISMLSPLYVQKIAERIAKLIEKKG